MGLLRSWGFIWRQQGANASHGRVLKRVRPVCWIIHPGSRSQRLRKRVEAVLEFRGKRNERLNQGCVKEVAEGWGGDRIQEKLNLLRGKSGDD